MSSPFPHNPNASNGLMFDTKTLTGGPITREYAERRMANLFLIAPRTDPYVRVYAYGSYRG